MKGAGLPPIPPPSTQRWNEVRCKLIPLIVLLACVVGVSSMWQDHFGEPATDVNARPFSSGTDVTQSGEGVGTKPTGQPRPKTGLIPGQALLAPNPTHAASLSGVQSAGALAAEGRKDSDTKVVRRPDSTNFFIGLSALKTTALASYTGMCDASAVVMISSNLFLAASDEDNILRLYSTRAGGLPLREFDLTRFLELERKSPEADIEAAARIGDRVFWIGSHGRNRKGKERMNRSRLFATDLTGNDINLRVTPAGRPCKTLLEQLIRDGRFGSFRLDESARLVPKDEDGLNIEGLAATREGQLLIGFRNPIPQQKALVVPLSNPDEVISGKTAKFGDPLLLDLGGLGIRDFVQVDGGFAILAGPHSTSGPFHLFRWAGHDMSLEMVNVSLKGYNPEALGLVPYEGRAVFLALSDDGAILVGGKPCKENKVRARRSFRAFWLEPS